MQYLQRVALKWKCLLLQGTKRCFSAVSRAWTSRTQMQRVIPSTSGWKMKQGVSISECFLCMSMASETSQLWLEILEKDKGGRESSALQLNTVLKLSCVMLWACGLVICSPTTLADVSAWWPRQGWVSVCMCVREPICLCIQGASTALCLHSTCKRSKQCSSGARCWQTCLQSNSEAGDSVNQTSKRL